MIMLKALLIILPIVVYRVARVCVPKHVYKATLGAFGVVVSPLAMGLYSLYFASPLGIPFAIIGLPLVLVHEFPAWWLLQALGLNRSDGMDGDVWVYFGGQLINAMTWGSVYGLIGGWVDHLSNKKRGQLPRPPSPAQS